MNALNAIRDYFQGAYAEMKKVTWPTKKQTTNYSLLVIAMSLGVALLFMVLDYVFNLGIEKIISL